MLQAGGLGPEGRQALVQIANLGSGAGKHATNLGQVCDSTAAYTSPAASGFPTDREAELDRS